MTDFLSQFTGDSIDERLGRVDVLIPKSFITQSLLENSVLMVPSAALSAQLHARLDDVENRYVNNDLDQSIQGRKNFLSPSLFSADVTLTSSSNIILGADGTTTDSVVTRGFVAKRAVDSGVAGNGLKVKVNPGLTQNTLEVLLDNQPGLAFKSGNGALYVDITGTPEAGSASGDDELLVYNKSSGSLLKIKKNAFLGELTKSLRFRGQWDPNTNTVIGDPLNTSLAKGTAPNTPPGDTREGFQYVVSQDGTFDLVDEESPEEFTTGDSVIWSGTSWVLIRDQTKVKSFRGAQGTARQGAVEASAGDYNTGMITHTSTAKVDVRASSVTSKSAIEDLDAYKLSNQNPVLTKALTLPAGADVDTALKFATLGSNSGLWTDGTSILTQVNGYTAYKATETGLVANGLTVSAGKVLTAGYDLKVTSNGTTPATYCNILASDYKIALNGAVHVGIKSQLIEMKDASGNVIVSLAAGTFQSNAPFWAPDGTAAAPSLGFSNATTTGFYQAGGKLGVSVGGTATWSHGTTASTSNVTLNMGSTEATAKQIKWLATPTDDFDAVNLKTLRAEIEKTYHESLTTTVSTTTAVTLFDMSKVDGMECVLLGKRDTARQMTKFLVTHNGSDTAYFTEYGGVGPDVFSIAFTISGTNLVMNITATNGTCVVKTKTIASF